MERAKACESWARLNTDQKRNLVRAFEVINLYQDEWRKKLKNPNFIIEFNGTDIGHLPPFDLYRSRLANKLNDEKITEEVQTALRFYFQELVEHPPCGDLSGGTLWNPMFRQVWRAFEEDEFLLDGINSAFQKLVITHVPAGSLLAPYVEWNGTTVTVAANTSGPLLSNGWPFAFPRVFQRALETVFKEGKPAPVSRFWGERWSPQSKSWCDCFGLTQTQIKERGWE